MDAAKQLVPDETEPLTWAEIARRYPDQYVCLVDIVHPRRGDPDIVSARVVGNGRRSAHPAPGPKAVKATGVLDKCSLPRHRQRHEQRVQAWIVEAFADVASGREHDAFGVCRDRCHPREHLARRLGAHPALEHDHVPRNARQLGGKVVEVIRALGEQERRPAFFERTNHVVENHSVPRLVVREQRVQLLDLGLRVGRPESGLTCDQPVLERTSGGLRLRVDREAHRAELHRLRPKLCKRRLPNWPGTTTARATAS